MGCNNMSNLWLTKLLMKLQVPLVMMLKLLHSPRLSTRLSNTTTPVPSPNPENPIHVMVPALKNSALSSSNVNSISDIIHIFHYDTAKVNYILFFMKGSTLDCF